MGYKLSDPCLKNAYNDEKLFVLMARDQSAPLVIMEWIKLNLTLQPREKLIEALDVAIEMTNRRIEFIERKSAEAKGEYCRDCGGPCQRKDVIYEEDLEESGALDIQRTKAPYKPADEFLNSCSECKKDFFTEVKRSEFFKHLCTDCEPF
jgi:hypothetical protein